MLYPLQTSLQDLAGFEALCTHLRPPEYEEPPHRDLAARAAAYDAALQKASEAGELGFSSGTYVRPHLVRKYLIRIDFQEVCAGRGLSLAALLRLGLPDENKYLESISSYARKKYQLATKFNCHPLLLSCFACLARAPLQQFPAALAFAEQNPALVQAAVDEYWARHGYAPSPERLFQLLLGGGRLTARTEPAPDEDETGTQPEPEDPAHTASATSPAASVAPKAARKPRARPKRAAAKAHSTAAPARSRSRSNLGRRSSAANPPAAAPGPPAATSSRSSGSRSNTFNITPGSFCLDLDEDD